MRGIIFCAHLSGIGHLVRMMTLTKALLEEGEVVFIQAGREEGVAFTHPRLTHIALPFSQDFKHFYLKLTQELKERLIKQFKLRRKLLFKSLPFDRPYDYLVTEQIPFTKLLFFKEVEAIYETARLINPKLALISSQKGGSPLDPFPGDPSSGKEREKIELFTLSHLNGRYDKLLLHCDPAISPLEEMYSHAKEIKIPIEYTGYITTPLPKRAIAGGRKKEILVTTGGGEKGGVLIAKVLELIPSFPDYTFSVVIGPLTPPPVASHLYALEKRISNLKVVGFIENLPEKLLQVSLAITLGGSTLINLYAAKTPAIAYPAPSDAGQLLLAKKFASRNIVRLLEQGELEGGKLASIIDEVLREPPQYSISIDIDGAEKSRKAIFRSVAEKWSPRQG